VLLLPLLLPLPLLLLGAWDSAGATASPFTRVFFHR